MPSVVYRFLIISFAKRKMKLYLSKDECKGHLNTFIRQNNFHSTRENFVALIMLASGYKSDR